MIAGINWEAVGFVVFLGIVFLISIVGAFIPVLVVLIKVGVISFIGHWISKRFKPSDIEKTSKPKSVKILPLKKRYKPKIDIAMFDDCIEQSEIGSNRASLRKALTEFGAQVRIINEDIGPRLTTYNLRMNPGNKPDSIVGLEDALKMRLRAKAIRIHAPIAGTNLVGIEVPNAESRIVSFKETMSSENWNKCEIPLALGLDISGEPVIIDLTKMPHLLIAGATGSGKSVCIHSLIMSMIYNFRPDEMRLVLIDPKQVEFHAYRNIPHLLTPVIDDTEDVPNTLQWIVSEMEKRYGLLKKECVRTIKSYNEKCKKDLPYIVVVIDELADLMMTTDRKDAEHHLCRLAQMARAVGIHVIVATQRPTVNVITGMIKANFPARIAFQVASVVDSRVILDCKGAESLLGCGDMLYSGPSELVPSRIQGCYLTDAEIERITTNL